MNQEVSNLVVKKIAEANFPRAGDSSRSSALKAHLKRPMAPATEILPAKEEAVALVMGDIHAAPPLVRIHSQCLTGDVFHSMRCDCRQQLELALSLITRGRRGHPALRTAGGSRHRPDGQAAGLRTPGQRLRYRGSQRRTRLRQRLSRVQAARRNARQLGLSEVRLISNNPDKVAALENAGIKVVERVPAEVEPYEHSENYLRTKKEKMGHLLTGW